MTFTLGIAIGFLIGATIGTAITAIMVMGKMSDMQDRLDAWEATRWQR